MKRYTSIIPTTHPVRRYHRRSPSHHRAAVALALLALAASGTLALLAGGVARYPSPPAIQPSASPLAYTTVAVTDPVLQGIDPAASRALVDALLRKATAGTGTAADGATTLPHAEPASLLVTRDVVEALVALDGAVDEPLAAQLAAWIWSRWHASGGYFDDEYSMDWTVVADGTGFAATNRYSPVVATGCALDALSMLGRPANVTALDMAAGYVLSCHDAATGRFRGVPGTSEPILQDAAWAVRVLWRAGRLASVDGDAIAAYIATQRNAAGLFHFHSPAVLVAAPEYMGGTIAVTGLALDALALLGRVGAVDGVSVRNAVMALYSTSTRLFKLSSTNPDKVALATAEALRSLAIVGFPGGFEANELPWVSNALAARQLAGGGWAYEDGEALAVVSHSARVVSALQAVAGNTGAVDLSRFRSAVAGALATGPGGVAAGYCPYPGNYPAFTPGAALATLAARHGLLGEAAAVAARQLVAASYADNSGTTPRRYPLVGEHPFLVPQEYRTMRTTGISVLAARVALKDALGEPFTVAELQGIAAALGGLQYRGTAVPGIRGLCLADPSLGSALSIPTVALRAASLESTVAALRAIDVLKAYGNGTWFVPSRFMDLGLLCTRLAAGYREAGTAAWFEREAPATFQQAAGPDNARLRDTRLALEALVLSGTLGHPSAAAVNLAKLVATAMAEPLRTAADADDAEAIVAMANGTSSSPAQARSAAVAASLRLPGTGWHARCGLRDATETTRAFTMLARFSGGAATLGHVVIDATSVIAYAGTAVTLTATSSNCLTGPAAGVPFDYSTGALGLAGTGVTGTARLEVPLAEAVLGPARVLVAVAGSLLSVDVTVRGLLHVPREGDGVVVPAPAREPFEAVLAVSLASPDDPSRRVPAAGAVVAAIGTSIAHNATFACGVDGKFRAELHVDPWSDATRYRLVAAREWCDGIDAELAVRCADNLSLAPLVAGPLGGAGACAGFMLLWGRRKRRVGVTGP